MNEFTTQWLIPTITNLIAAAIVYVIGRLIAAATASKSNVKGVATKAASTIGMSALRAAPYIFIFWFLIGQLRALLEPASPPSRLDSALIAFWMFWFLLMSVRLLAGRPLAFDGRPD